MNTVIIRRIFISTIISVVLCFTGSIVIISGNETTTMTIIECLLKYDKNFFIQKSIVLSSAASAGLSSLWLSILLPFITSLSGLFAFADTMQGFWRMEYIRKSKRYYRLKKFLTICTFGAIPAALGYLIYVIAIIPFFPYGLTQQTRNEDGTAAVINTAPPLREFLGTIGSDLATLFLVAFITSALCLCIFLAVQNRYKSVGMPLIMYYLLYEVSMALYAKFIRDFRLFIISPYFIVSTGKAIITEAFSAPYIFLFIGLLLIIAGFYVLYYFLLNRRLEQ